METLENLETIADGIRELYPTADVTVAIDLSLSDIDQVLSNFGEEGKVASDTMKMSGATVSICIKQITFALFEKKIDPMLN